MRKIAEILGYKLILYVPLVLGLENEISSKNRYIFFYLRCWPAIALHAKGKLIGASFRLGKDDCLAVALAHNFSH